MSDNDPVSTAISPSPRKPRQPRAPKVPVEKKQRAKPRTLAKRISDMGPHHLDAYHLLAKKGSTFRSDLRAALDLETDVLDATQRLHAAQAAVVAAEADLKALVAKADAAKATLEKLDATSKWLWTTLGDGPRV